MDNYIISHLFCIYTCLEMFVWNKNEKTPKSGKMKTKENEKLKDPKDDELRRECDP